MAERIPVEIIRRLFEPDASAIPKAPRLPVVGSIPAIVHEQFDFFDRARAECGPIFEVDLGVAKAVLLADPELVEQVLVKQAANFDKGDKFWVMLREGLGNGLALSEGEHWRRQRRLMNPKFRRQRIESFRQTISATTKELLDQLGAQVQAAPRAPVDIAEWTPKLLSTLTVRILFGMDANPHYAKELRRALTEVLDHAMAGMVTRNLPAWVPVPGAQRFENARQVIDDRVLALIADRRERGLGQGDLLSMLIEATDEQGAMSNRDLRDEVVITYVAGYETTAWALAWALWLVAGDPKICREAQAALDDEADPTKVPMVDAIVREALRLYPSGPFIPRRAAKDVELGGFPIAAGTSVAPSPWLIHRNPEIWPDPERFDPYRFLDEEQVQARHKLAWMPFGAGQRICIGKGLAMMEATTGVGELLRRFTPSRVPGEDPKPKISSTLRPRDGIRLRLQPR